MCSKVRTFKTTIHKVFKKYLFFIGFKFNLIIKIMNEINDDTRF